MGEVINLDMVTRLDIPIERILDGAVEANLTDAIVLGWDEDGSLYFARSMANGPETLWLLEIAKTNLMDMALGDG